MNTYEKKYKEANDKVAARFGTNVAKEIFTDLYESEDERIRKELITHCRNTRCVTEEGAERIAKWIAWLEKQGKEKSKKASIWKHWKDGIAGNGEGKLIYLIKNGNDYILSSCLGFECDYIELSELDNLMLEKQGEQKASYTTIVETGDGGINALAIRELPIEMKSAEESLGIDSETYNKIVDECIYGDDKQKPAWSCEDETRLQACLDTLQANSLMGRVDTTMTKWLKSLKQRIAP